MIKIGIISGASIVSRFVSGVKESGIAQVTAIATRNLVKAQELAKELGISKAYGSYDELLKDKEIELVYIPLINHLHFSVAKAAIMENKHVLLEKPFTLTEKEASELFRLAEEKGVFLMEAQKAVFLPSIKEVKKLLQEEKIGKIKYVDIRDSRPNPDKIPWYWNIQNGGGVLISNASYPLSLLQYFFGVEFDAYDGYCIKHDENLADEQCLLHLKKENILINLYLTTEMDFESTFTIVGDKGKIVIPNYWKTDHFMIEKKDGVVIKKEYLMDSEFVFEICHAVEQIKKENLVSSVVDPTMTLTNVRVVEHMYKKWFGSSWGSF